MVQNRIKKGWADYYGNVARPEERYVDDSPRPQPSGLYNADGRPLYKLPNPVGFETDSSRRFPR